MQECHNVKLKLPPPHLLELCIVYQLDGANESGVNAMHHEQHTTQQCNTPVVGLMRLIYLYFLLFNPILYASSGVGVVTQLPSYY